MTDYENRLRRLEDRVADCTDEGEKEFAELCRKRALEFLASKEVQAYAGREISEEEWAAEWAPIQAAIDAAQGKR